MPSSEINPSDASIEDRLQYAFRDPSLLQAALTHPSFAAEAGAGSGPDNQRLEFLGDAVLGVIAAEWLMEHCLDWKEGQLTQVRSRLTNTETLAGTARRIRLGDELRLGRGEEASGGRDRDAALADALEAILGAVWLDGGLEAVRCLFPALFGPDIDGALTAGGEDNPKGELQESLQGARRGLPRYELISEEGPPHQPSFTVRVSCGESVLGEGRGASKREAETAAARVALKSLDAGSKA